MLLRLVVAPVHALSKAGLRQLLAKLVAEKGISGVARGREEKAFLVVPDHGKKRVRRGRIHLEIIVVDDHVDPLADARQLPIQVVCQPPDVLGRLDAQPLKNELGLRHLVQAAPSTRGSTKVCRLTGALASVRSRRCDADVAFFCYERWSVCINAATSRLKCSAASTKGTCPQFS